MDFSLSPEPHIPDVPLSLMPHAGPRVTFWDPFQACIHSLTNTHAGSAGWGGGTQWWVPSSWNSQFGCIIRDCLDPRSPYPYLVSWLGSLPFTDLCFSQPLPGCHQAHVTTSGPGSQTGGLLSHLKGLLHMGRWAPCPGFLPAWVWGEAWGGGARWWQGYYWLEDRTLGTAF